jgi:hypothetical protein
MTKKLPIGLQGFEDIRTNNYIYVDKTKYFYELIESGKIYFLSRPRRFGKSLTLDTFKCLFEGKKELFDGLYIYDKWDWSKTYPVVLISFGGSGIESVQDLENYILNEINNYALKYSITIEEITYGLQLKNAYHLVFKNFILNLYKKYGQVVVLIDEYDKPILDNINNEETAIKIRERLKKFYEVLKEVNSSLRFLFITGVSKFTKTSIFSGLNNLYDITLEDKYSAICGYTQSELEFYFKDYLKDIDLQNVKEWYNGYFWGKSIDSLKQKASVSVCNPYDILLFFAGNNIFESHWFRTGNPKFLTEILLQKKFFTPSLENIEIEISDLDVFDIDTIEVNALLFQTGYLTVKNIKEKGSKIYYDLTYPNLEVRQALNSYLIPYYLKGKKDVNDVDYGSLLHDAFINEKIDDVIEILKSMYAAIPHDWYRKSKLYEFEGYYATVFYSIMQGAGLKSVAEDKTNQGRVDLSIHTQKTIYIMEFKVSEETKTKSKKVKILKSKAKKNKAVQKSSKTSKTNGALIALKQILEKKYYEKYLNENKKIVLVGIEFSKKLRNIKDYKIKEIVTKNKIINRI